MAAWLLERVARGDSGAARDCIARFGSLVWSLARRRSPNAAEAEDAVQEIFVDLWRSAPRFNPSIASEVAFVGMIARRRLIDRARRRMRRTDTEPLPADLPSEAPTAGAETCIEARRAAEAVSKLRPEQRKVLLLATCDGLTHEEIAARTGMPLGTVKTHVRRGLLRVREALLGRMSSEKEAS